MIQISQRLTLSCSERIAVAMVSFFIMVVVASFLGD